MPKTYLWTLHCKNYMNYLVFLNSYCVDHDSQKCLQLLNPIIEKLGFSKNQHKKNLIKYIKWK